MAKGNYSVFYRKQFNIIEEIFQTALTKDFLGFKNVKDNEMSMFNLVSTLSSCDFEVIDDWVKDLIVLENTN